MPLPLDLPARYILITICVKFIIICFIHILVDNWEFKYFVRFILRRYQQLIYIASAGRIADKSSIGKDLEGSGRSVIVVLSRRN
jgi:hypothetical protein